MKLIVNPHKIKIEKTPVNEKEINVTEIEFEFDEKITNSYVKEAYFTLNNNSYKKVITNNKCDIPSEVLTEKGQIEIGVVAYLVENEEEIKRYNPSPVYINTWKGSLKTAKNSTPITPSEMEQYEQALEDGLNEVANVDIDAEQTVTGGTVTITNRQGQEKTVTLTNGQAGADAKINGVNTISIEAGQNVTIDQTGNTLTINSTGGGSGGTSNYNNLNNKPKINNVELVGNKTTSDLGIIIPDVSSFITRTDYATNSVGGVIVPSTYYALHMNTNGTMDAQQLNYNDYLSKAGASFISKTTLENVITGKGLTSNTGTITSVKMNGNTVSSSGEADLGTVLVEHQDISGKLDTSKVKNTASTTSGEVYDVTYINSTLGDIESLLNGI